MITLYKKGDTHTIKGVQCEIKTLRLMSWIMLNH